MYKHKFKETTGLLLAKDVVGNVALSDDKLEEGEQIARQLVENFGHGGDLAVRVGYDDGGRIDEAKSRLDALTNFKAGLEESCEDIKDSLDGKLGTLRQLVLGAPGAAASTIGDERADVGAIVLQLLPLVVTDLPAALDKFPGLRDALSPETIEVRQTQISSGQVDDEQLQDLRKQVERLGRKCDEETDRANSADKGKREAESRLKTKSAESRELGGKLAVARGELKNARDANARMQGSLDELRTRAGDLKQRLVREQVRVTQYKNELTNCEARLEVADTNAENDAATVASLRRQLQSERGNKTQAARLSTQRRLEDELQAEVASHAASRDSHEKNQKALEVSHKTVTDRMQGQVEELRSELLKARHEISSKDTSLGKMQVTQESLARRLKNYQKRLEDKTKRMDQAKSDARGTINDLRADVDERDEKLQEKESELAARDEKLAGAESTMARLRGERDNLRARSEAAAASSVGLKDAQRRINELTHENGKLQRQCADANEKQSSAEKRLDARTHQLRKLKAALDKRSAEVDGLKEKLSDSEEYLRSVTDENDGLKDEAQDVQRTIQSKQAMIEDKSKLIEEQSDLLSELDARANRDRESLDRELRQLRNKLADAEGRLSDRVRELRSAQRAREQALELRATSAEQQDLIESLQKELASQRAHGSDRAEEMTENNRKTSLFLANMAGFGSGPGEVMFGGLVDAIINGGDKFCVRAAPDVRWKILPSWNGTPAGATGTFSPAPRVVNLQIGAVLLLGDAASGHLNTERSRSILDDLIASVCSEDTLELPVPVLTELAGKVVRTIREAGNVRVEFSLAFWQLMWLVDHRTGRVSAADSPWGAHRAMLSAELGQHPCSLVFEVLRDNVELAGDEHCRRFGDAVWVCSRQDWKSAVMFDTEARTMRFVDKDLVSTPGMRTLRIGPEPGYDAVELQLQPPDNMWLMQYI